MVRLQTRMPSLSNSPRRRSAPQSRFCAAISLIKATVSVGIFGLEDAALDLYFQNRRASLAMPAQERLWLDNEKRLLPCTRRSSEKEQDETIRLCAGWSFDLPTEDDELLPEKGVFCHELGLASGKVGHRTQHKRGIGRFSPVDEAVVERLKTHMSQALDEGNNILHSIRFLILKMSRYMPFDSTLLPGNRQGVRKVLSPSNGIIAPAQR
jgi:hypothetical protein